MRYTRCARCFGFVGLIISACSSQAARVEPGSGTSSTGAHGETSPNDVSTSHDEGGVPVRDAGGDAAPIRSPTSNAAPEASTDFTTSADGSATTTSAQVDASVILPPRFEELSLAELCDRVAELEGENVDVDLTGGVQVAEWQIVAGRTDAAADRTDGGASVCATNFAAYVVECARSVLVLSAPTLAFGEGPIVGGEQVGFGCWELGCEEGCIPETTATLGKVRVRVSAALAPRYTADAGATRGDVRINGVDIEAAALLEILALR